MNELLFSITSYTLRMLRVLRLLAECYISRVISFVILCHHCINSHISLVGLHSLLINKKVGQHIFNLRLLEDGRVLGYSTV